MSKKVQMPGPFGREVNIENIAAWEIKFLTLTYIREDGFESSMELEPEHQSELKELIGTLREEIPGKEGITKEECYIV